MDQLLGLYTSPNSLQLPPGATLRADNVYLDTDGYFKPFKKVEKVFTDLQLVGETGARSTYWNTSDARYNIVLKDGYLLLILSRISSPSADSSVLLNTTLMSTTESTGSASIEVYQQIGARYTDDSDTTGSYASRYFGYFEVADFIVLGQDIARSHDSDNFLVFAKKEVINPNGGYPILIGKMKIVPPSVIGTTYDTPPSRVYDGDAANNTDRFYANAYRLTLSIQVGDYLIESRPTGSIYVRGSNASLAPGVWVEEILMNLPGQLGVPATNFFLNIYRIPLELADNATTDLVPRESDDYRLVSTINFKTTTNSYTFTDDEVMPPGSAELYTNETQDGIIEQNEALPKFKVCTYYKGAGFYGNIEINSPITLNVKQGNVGTYSGFWLLRYTDPSNGYTTAMYAPVEYSVNLAIGSNDSNFTLGLLYSSNGLLNNYNTNINAYHANSSGTGVTIVLSCNIAGDSLTFIDRGGVVVGATYDFLLPVATITKAGHGLTTNDRISLYIVDDNLQGAFFEPQVTVVDPNTFTVPANFSGFSPVVGGTCKYIAFAPGVTPTTSGIFTNITASGSEIKAKQIPNGLVFTKTFQPFTTTATKQYTVGSSLPILFIANLREYLLIFKEDGVFILRGDSAENYTIDPLYPQLILTDSRAIQVIDDYVVGLFTIGVVKLNENGFEPISQQIRDDIENMVKGIGSSGANISNYPPTSFYHKSKRLFMIGRERVSVTPDSASTAQGEMFPSYTAHDAFVYHLDSKQWTKCNKIFLEGAYEVGSEIYFMAMGDRTTTVTPPSPNLPFDVNFKSDIYRTEIDSSAGSYTSNFRIRFVKRMMTEDGKGGHFRYLKLYFREMNLTSLTVRYYNNYDFSDNSEYYETTYSDIVTFDDDGSAAYSRSVAYLMIPMEVARGEWLSFEIFNAVSSEVDVIKYNGILLEGVEMVTTPGKSVTI